MSVKIMRTSNNQVAIPNYYLDHQNLSLEEMGLLCQMCLSDPEEGCTIEELVALCADKKEVVKMVLKKLENAGYVKSRRIQNDKMKFYLSDIEQFSNNPHGEDGKENKYEL